MYDNPRVDANVLVPGVLAHVPGGLHDAAASVGLLEGGRNGRQLAQGRHERRVFIEAAPYLPGELP